MTFTKEQIEYFAGGAKPLDTDYIALARQLLVVMKREQWARGEVQQLRAALESTILIAGDREFRASIDNAMTGRAMAEAKRIDEERRAWVNWVEGRLLAGLQSAELVLEDGCDDDDVKRARAILEDLEQRICSAHGKPPVEEPTE